ncbi:kinase [Luteimonas sp. R10]|uniref:kinase n=1 Tax=Luteimonas sp. R10 TaxID=3108176 RepID=UPI00308C2511|nr:kinase [Luteimonas sp. R10]
MAPPPHPTSGNGFANAFVARVLDDALASGARVYGICGLQGSGKSTLADQVAALARARGIRTTTVSLDDFYLERAARAALARDVHPLLATRGPPGTHDLALACATLDALRAGAAVAVPRFDKIADTRLPRGDWPCVEGTALTIFEGWCLCTPAEDAAALAEPVNALERDEDRDGAWRSHCNRALARDYPRLWRRIDRLLFLRPPGFDIVPAWRWQQEQTLQRAAPPRRRTMSRAEVERFVQHYERVSRQALRTLPAIAQWTVALSADRVPDLAP